MPVASTFVAPSREPLDGPVGRLTQAWYPIQGRRLHARVSLGPHPEDAPTAILVHGVATSSRYLVPLAERLAPYARVWLPDLPGYGQSESPPGDDLTVPELADALCAWMDRAGVRRAHLVGNSFGCQVIVDLAARYPERVDRLVLQGPTMDRHARTFWQQALRWLAVTPFERYAEGAVLLRDLWDLGARRAIGMIEIGLNDLIELKLPHVAAPTLVVRGTRDTIVPEAWAEEVTALLQDGRLTVVPGAAHTINYSQPAWLADVILPFLRGADQEEDARFPRSS